MTSLSPKIGVCESRFSTVLKPHRHDPDCRDVTAIGKGHGSIPRRTQPTWWAFSRSLFACGCMSCHLGVRRVSIDGPSRWCADRMLERKSALLSVRLGTCSWLSPLLSLALRINSKNLPPHRLPQRGRYAPYSASRPSKSLIPLSLWWDEAEGKLSKLNYPTFKGADINLYAINFAGHIIAARIKNTKDGGLLTSSTLRSLWQLEHTEQASIAPLRRTSF